MSGFVLSWAAHRCLSPGISLASTGSDAAACIAAFLPLSQQLAASRFLLTLVTPNCAGSIPLERGPCRVLGVLE